MTNRQAQSPNYLYIGKIVGTHGIRGDVRVLESTDFPEKRFAKGKQVFLFLPKESEPIILTIEKSRPHKNVRLVKFVEYDNINEVERFRDGRLAVSATDRLQSEESQEEYYYDEVIGSLVVIEDGEELGTVQEILSLPANDVWVVRSKDKKEILLPFIEEVVRQVDVAKKRITIRWMEGLA